MSGAFPYHLCYEAKENLIVVSNEEKSKTLEWVHKDLLRIYEVKNSEELVKLNYRREAVAFEVIQKEQGIFITCGDYEIFLDENLTVSVKKAGNPYFEEFFGPETVIYEKKPITDLTDLEGHKTEEILADFKSQINIRLFDDEDKIYGLGDKAAQLNHRDYVYVSWNTDDPSPHNENYRSLYKSINYLLVNHHQSSYYGIFYPSSYKTMFNLGKYNKKFMFIGSPKGEYDYFLILGENPKEITSCFVELMGKPLFTPMKFLGYHASRWSYSEEKMEELRRDSKELDLPLDYIHMDIDYMDHYKVYTVSKDYVSDMEDLTRRFGEDGIGIITIIDPAVKREEGYELYDTLTENHGFATLDGEDYVNTVWPGESKFPNYFDSKTADYLTEVTKNYMNKYGVSGIWCDMNEPASFNGPLPDNVEFPVEEKVHYHDEVHNLYGEYMVKAVAKAFEEENRRPAVITRAAFGTSSQYTTSWNGDNQSLWHHLAASLPQVMTMNICGFMVNGVDIGGFGGDTNKELLLRWIEANVFSPFFRNHSSINTRNQEPTAFDEETLEIYRKYLQLRYQFMPYLYDLLYKAHKEGVPMYRPLFYDFPEERKVKEINDQVMIGDLVMLAPMVTQGSTSRIVYFPKGKWVNYFTNEIYEGEKEYIVSMKLGETGLFVKAGAVLPMFKDLLHIEKSKIDTLYLYLAPGGEESTYIHYEDDGETLDYRKGIYNLYRFTRKGDEVTMEMEHEGYESTYKEIVILDR